MNQLLKFSVKELEDLLTQQKQETADWQEIAGESLRVEYVGNSPFAYGSKEACQKLKQALGTGTAEYTPVLGMWFYTTYVTQFQISYQPINAARQMRASKPANRPWESA